RRHKDFQSFALPTELSSLTMYGGGRGIRTPAGFDTPVGFQDRSLQPDLGIPPNLKWTLQDSNLRPIGYEPIALTNRAKGPNGSGGGDRTHDLTGMNRTLSPAELRRHFKFWLHR